MDCMECELNVWCDITYALRWGVTHVGDYHNWVLLTSSWDPPFKYRECLGRRRSVEAAFEKKADMWL